MKRVMLILFLGLCSSVYADAAQPTGFSTNGLDSASIALSNEVLRIRQEMAAMNQRMEERRKTYSKTRSANRVIEAKPEGKVIVNDTTNSPIATSEGVQFKFQKKKSGKGTGINWWGGDRMGRQGFFIGN